MRWVYRDNSHTICHRVHLPGAKQLSINHENEKAGQSFSSSFEISEIKWTTLFLFHSLFTICIIYNGQLHICDSNVTWN